MVTAEVTERQAHQQRDKAISRQALHRKFEGAVRHCHVAIGLAVSDLQPEPLMMTKIGIEDTTRY